MVTRIPHRLAARVALALAVAVAFGLLTAASASAITRSEVLSRAQRRVDAPVPYSQSKYYAGYRTDCSGYVSMCWATGTSYSTRSFYLVTSPITVAQLRPGDAMLRPGYHIRLFYGWLDSAKTQYIAYESASNQIAGVRVRTLADDLASGFAPVRYDHISNGTSSGNLLRNPSFDTWVNSWEVGADQPVWWAVQGARGQLIATRRMDAYQSASNSLRLSNPATLRSSTTQITQITSASAGVKYRVTAWATTACDPALVELRASCLGPAMETLTETVTTGAAAGIGGSGFRKMSFIIDTPTGTAAARVTVRLGGGSSADASGVPVPGTSVLVDEISLVRPSLAVGMNTDASSFYGSRTIKLSGTVSPMASIGTTASVYVKRPGATSWSRITSMPVTASGTNACWRASYAITRGMARGTYYFKTVVAAAAGYAPGTSRTASVRKR